MTPLRRPLGTGPTSPDPEALAPAARVLSPAEFAAGLAPAVASSEPPETPTVRRQLGTGPRR
jgi:hypothetical protein